MLASLRLSISNSVLPPQPIQDPDPLINCDLMDGRDAFLTMARDRHYEFSSTRRSCFSTLCMLYELHNQGTDKFVYTCNSCKSHVETRYHCTVCDDFDLCVPCHEKEGHPHKMEKLGLDIDVGASPGDMKQANPQEARKLSIQRCIQSLVHACQCRDANCRLPSCQKMKRVVTHTKICKRKTKGDCPICKQLIALCCYHAKHCQETKCSVPFCSSIKQKLKQQQVQQRVQQAKLLRRRMAAMNTRAPAPSPPPPALASPPPSKPQPHALPHNVQKALQQVTYTILLLYCLSSSIFSLAFFQLFLTRFRENYHVTDFYQDQLSRFIVKDTERTSHFFDICNHSGCFHIRIL